MRDNVIRFPATSAACASCRWLKLCGGRAHPVSADRPQAVNGSAVCGPLPRRSNIFHQGDVLGSLYLLRSGSVKTYVTSADGCEQIVAFHFPGDILGLDAAATGFHESSAVTLETSAVCSLPYQRLQQLGADDAGEVWAGLLAAAAQQTVNKQQHALLLGQKCAQARFAALLLHLSDRFAARGCSRTEFNLSMSRQELANYLAVAVETVSRLFTDLQRRRVLKVERRFVRILSLPALARLANQERALEASHG